MIAFWRQCNTDSIQILTVFFRAQARLISGSRKTIPCLRIIMCMNEISPFFSIFPRQITIFKKIYICTHLWNVCGQSIWSITSFCNIWGRWHCRWKSHYRKKFHLANSINQFHEKKEIIFTLTWWSHWGWGRISFKIYRFFSSFSVKLKYIKILISFALVFN